MKPFILEVEVSRPVHDVFTFLAESENMPLWYEAVAAARRLTPGPVQRGTLYQVTRVLPQGRVVNEVETSEYESDRRITFTSRTGPTPFTYRCTLRPTPHGTYLALEGTISGEGLEGPMSLLAPLARNLFRNGMRTNLERLKSKLENAGDDRFHLS